MPILIRELVVTALIADAKEAGEQPPAQAPGNADARQVVAEVLRILKTQEER
ncbi:MAG: hypothetical protein H6559_04130 [Lewinellaceae bacterium]|nr:hypothetical protein [Lewinellaceae bacterium]